MVILVWLELRTVQYLRWGECNVHILSPNIGSSEPYMGLLASVWFIQHLVTLNHLHTV